MPCSGGFMKSVLNSIAVFALAVVLGSASPAHADTLDDIVADGKLVAGIKTDYPPWGMRDSDGQIVGLEIDLVRDLAKRIGEKAGKTIEVELVPVVASNRMQFLEQGRIDVMIATMNDLPDRRKIVGSVFPNYYSSGVAVLISLVTTSKLARSRSWDRKCESKAAHGYSTA